MSILRTITFWAGISACLVLGTLVAVTELIGCGTKLDWVAEWLAQRG